MALNELAESGTQLWALAQVWFGAIYLQSLGDPRLKWGDMQCGVNFLITFFKTCLSDLFKVSCLFFNLPVQYKIKSQLHHHQIQEDF